MSIVCILAAFFSVLRAVLAIVNSVTLREQGGRGETKEATGD